MNAKEIQELIDTLSREKTVIARRVERFEAKHREKYLTVGDMDRLIAMVENVDKITTAIQALLSLKGSIHIGCDY